MMQAAKRCIFRRNKRAAEVVQAKKLRRYFEVATEFLFLSNGGEVTNNKDCSLRADTLPLG